nr:unnamed protein product [Callosobruchus chinensis]
MIWNLLLSVLGNAFYDILYIYCVQHLLVQYILLKELLKGITQGIEQNCSDLERFHSEHFQEAVMRRLKICVEHHNKLLRYRRARSYRVFRNNCQKLKGEIPYNGFPNKRCYFNIQRKSKRCLDQYHRIPTIKNH